MTFDSYIVSDTKTSLSMPLAPTPKELKHSKGFKGFTLAETLITLTIIGVIAALTVPNLLNKYTKHTYVVGLKKAYSRLSNAMKMIPITEGCSAGDYDCAGMFQEDGKATNIDEQDFEGGNEKKMIYLLSKQFKVQKFCYNYNANTDMECKKILDIDIFGIASVGFLLEDGSIFYTNASDNLEIDINGFKGPNKHGRDIFGFKMATETKNNVQQGQLMPCGSKLEATYTSSQSNYWRNNNCTTERPYIQCTGRVLEEDAMNY